MRKKKKPTEQSKEVKQAPVKPTGWGDRVFWFVFHAVCFLMLIQALVLSGKTMMSQAMTSDFAWLLRVGEYILEQRRLPATDIFTWTVTDQSWMLHQWLFNVLIAYGNRLFGEGGLLSSVAAFVTVLYLLLPLVVGRIRKIPVIFTTLVSVLCLMSISANVTLSPIVVTAFLMALLYFLIRQFRRGKLSFRVLYFSAVLIFVLWSNLHVMLVPGIILLLVLMAAGDWLERRQLYRYDPPSVSADEGSPLGVKPYLVLIVACLGATLINPYGFGTYGHLSELIPHTYLIGFIQDLASPDFHQTSYRFFLVLFGLFILLMPRSNRIFAAHEILLLLVFTLVMLFVQRVVLWTCLLYVLILPKALYYWWLVSRQSDSTLHYAVTGFERWRYPVLATVGLGLILLVASPQTLLTEQHNDPCQNVLSGVKAYAALRQPNDRLLNDAELGSCMLRILPEQKVFIDTRYEFYSKQFVLEHYRALTLYGNWEKFLQKWQINTVVMNRAWPLVRILAASADFTTLYEDQSVIILQRRSP